MVWPQAYSIEIDTTSVDTVKGWDKQDRQEGCSHPYPWPFTCVRRVNQYNPEKTASYWHHEPKLCVRIQYSLWYFTSWSHAICSPNIRPNHNVPDCPRATSRRWVNHNYSCRQEERGKSNSTPTSIVHRMFHCGMKLSSTPKGFIWRQLPAFHTVQGHHHNSQGNISLEQWSHQWKPKV